MNAGKSIRAAILRKHDSIDGYIFACPHCKRYVLASHGEHTCSVCGGAVDNDSSTRWTGNVVFDGEVSWEN